MSTFWPAIASSSVSVAPHIANRNPPRSTNCAKLLGDVLLERRHVGEAERASPSPRSFLLLDEPRRVAIRDVELVELPREVFVEQVQPVVLREVAVLDLVVVDRRVLDAGVLERERHRVVPRQRSGGV